jgi:hypothetical protein
MPLLVVVHLMVGNLLLLGVAIVDGEVLLREVAEVVVTGGVNQTDL